MSGFTTKFLLTAITLLLFTLNLQLAGFGAVGEAKAEVGFGEVMSLATALDGISLAITNKTCFR